MGYFKKYIDKINIALNEMQITSIKEKALDQEEGLHKWCDLTQELKKAGKTMYFVGNGASAAMASHMSADASKNAGFKCQCFNDISFITAVANDVSYDQVFSMAIKRFADENDLLVTISSSGNSPNIISAIETAKEKNLKVITLSGLNPDNKSRQKGDLNFYVPADTYGLVEACHQVLLHCWLDLFMEIDNNK